MAQTSNKFETIVPARRRSSGAQMAKEMLLSTSEKNPGHKFPARAAWGGSAARPFRCRSHLRHVEAREQGAAPTGPKTGLALGALIIGYWSGKGFNLHVPSTAATRQMDSEDTEDPCFRSSQPEGTLDSTRANGLGQKEDTALLLAQF